LAAFCKVLNNQLLNKQDNPNVAGDWYREKETS
jgi:hypothetical protein